MSKKVTIKFISKIILLFIFSLALFTSCIQKNYSIDSERNMAILGTEDRMVVFVNPAATMILEIAVFIALFGILFSAFFGVSVEKTYDVRNTSGRLMGTIHTGQYKHIDGIGYGGVYWFCISAVLMHLIPIVFGNNIFFQVLFGATPLIAFIIALIADGSKVTDSVRKAGIACFIILCIFLLASIIHDIWPQSALGDFIKETVKALLTIGR